MHPLASEHWIRHDGPLHRRDPRAKLLALVSFLICAGVSHTSFSLTLLGAAACTGVLLTRVPLRLFVVRMMTILPIPGIFALMVWIAGDPDRAALLLARSVLSLAFVLVMVVSTPMPRLFSALSWARVPALVVDVLQFVYRYLFVVADEVWTMRQAAASRAGSGSFLAAISATGVLFARSHGRAEAVYRSMLARNYSGALTYRMESRLDRYDALLLGGATATCLAIGVSPRVF